MAKFHKLKILEVRKETADSVSISFIIADELKKEYEFIQGQYLTLKLNINGEEVRRSYSICSSPLENELRIAVKRVKDGKGSNFICDHLKPDSQVEVMTPMGGFHSEMNSAHKKNYVLCGGGSGITPLLSIIKTVLKAEPHSTVILFYGNLDEASTIFKNELDDLADKSSTRFRVYYVFDKPALLVDELYKGMMTKEKVRMLLDKHIQLSADSEYFVCGPLAMMDNVREVLEENKIEKLRIHIEYFTSAGSAASSTSGQLEKINAQVTTIMYGMETSFFLNSTGMSILDAALKAGVDVPFACKGAVCATCRGRVLEGKVHMDKNFALTETEVEEGFILTCQSHPITSIVKVDYDI